MTVLVTGGAGFIGSHFIDLLLARESTDKIICLDNFDDSYDQAIKRANVAAFSSDDRVVIVEDSFADTATLRRLLAEHQVRRIVHLGACAGVRASFESPRRYHEINVEGTRKLLEAARTASIERFVLISSSTVYGRGAEVPFQEDAPLGTPLSPYGQSKRAAELLGQSYWKTYQLPVVCLRPFSVYGPRARPDLAMSVFARAIIESRPLPLFGDGSIRRDFTYVGDICAGILAAMSAPSAVGEAINLGHHEPVAIRELIAIIEDALGTKAIIDRRPAFEGDMPITCADLCKAGRLLNYRPEVSLVDGTCRFVEWFRAQSGR